MLSHQCHDLRYLGTRYDMCYNPRLLSHACTDEAAKRISLSIDAMNANQEDMIELNIHIPISYRLLTTVEKYV